MSSFFRPATRTKSRLRMALDGVSGSGKTFTALRFAFTLGKRVAIINTESGAVEKYLGLAPDGEPWQFDVGYLPDFSPTSYTTAILQAGKDGYEVLIVDSLSHAWAGAGGALELKDKKAASTNNSFTAWKDITPMHNRMIEAILHSPCHVIATMRVKTDYVLETNSRGQQVPRKIGLEPVQRAGMEYEFDAYCRIDTDHVLTVTKTRCPEICDAVVVKPSAAFMEPVTAWLNDGSNVPADFFAVTDEDLRKHEKRVADDVVAATPPAPKKSVEEVMREAAERAAQEEAGSSSNSHASSATEATIEQQPALCTAKQRTYIEQLFDALSVNADDRVKAFERRKASGFQNLSMEGAADLVVALEKAKLAVNAKADAALPKIEPGTESLPAACGPCTADQEKSIKAKFEEWKQVDHVNATAAFKLLVKKLYDSGRRTLLELSANDAAKLYFGLQNKSLDGFLSRPLEQWKPGNPQQQPSPKVDQEAARKEAIDNAAMVS